MTVEHEHAHAGGYPPINLASPSSSSSRSPLDRLTPSPSTSRLNVTTSSEPLVGAGFLGDAALGFAGAFGAGFEVGAALVAAAGFFPATLVGVDRTL